MFNSIFDTTTVQLSISSMLIVSGIGILLGLLISGVHKFTSRCSKDFLITLSLLPIIVSAVMIMVNGNLGTGIVIAGAFALIRFRSIPAGAKELLNVFLSMAVGLALGMGQILFAVLFTTIVTLLELIYSKTKIFDNSKEEQLLKILVPEDIDYSTAFLDEFKKYTSSHRLLKTKTVNMGSLYKVSFLVVLKTKKEKEFLDAIRVKNSNLQVFLSSVYDEKEL